MKIGKGTVDSQVKKREGFVENLVRRKQTSIQNSLVRPLYQEVLKSLFLVLVLLLDMLIPLEIYRDISSPYNIVVSLVVLGVFVYGEIRVYNSFWGKKGRWSLDKYEHVVEKSGEKKNN